MTAAAATRSLKVDSGFSLFIWLFLCSFDLHHQIMTLIFLRQFLGTAGLLSSILNTAPALLPPPLPLTRCSQSPTRILGPTHQLKHGSSVIIGVHHWHRMCQRMCQDASEIGCVRE